MRLERVIAVTRVYFAVGCVPLPVGGRRVRASVPHPTRSPLVAYGEKERADQASPQASPPESGQG